MYQYTLQMLFQTILFRQTVTHKNYLLNNYLTKTMRLLYEYWQEYCVYVRRRRDT